MFITYNKLLNNYTTQVCQKPTPHNFHRNRNENFDWKLFGQDNSQQKRNYLN